MGKHPVTRFAPSPTGELHLGHAYSALVASHLGNGYVLRIDDIDHTRCRTGFTEQILDDLQWLGLEWTGNPVYQSHRHDHYAAALQRLKDMNLVYPCYLTRRELAEVLSAPHDQQDSSASIPVATDRLLSETEKAIRAADGTAAAWRLRTEQALAMAGAVSWHDQGTGVDVSVDMAKHGDVVIARRDIETSYHLCVVVDDHLDGVDLVTRGADLRESTHVHRLLQAVLGLPSPAYFHHQLITDSTGARLAKRDAATSLRIFRENGLSATDILTKLPQAPQTLPQLHC